MVVKEAIRTGKPLTKEGLVKQAMVRGGVVGVERKLVVAMADLLDAPALTAERNGETRQAEAPRKAKKPAKEKKPRDFQYYWEKDDAPIFSRG